MTEHTPTTEDVRDCATNGYLYSWIFEVQFDRWFAAEIAEAEQRGAEHRIVRVWQERPSTMEWCEVSYRCSCGMVFKHMPMPIGEGHDVEYVCAAARGGAE